MSTPTTSVTRVTENITIGANGQQSRSYLIQFTVGSNGPFTVTIPQDQFNPDAVKKAMQAVADTISKLPMGA